MCWALTPRQSRGVSGTYPSLVPRIPRPTGIAGFSNTGRLSGLSRLVCAAIGSRRSHQGHTRQRYVRERGQMPLFGFSIRLDILTIAIVPHAAITASALPPASGRGFPAGCCRACPEAEYRPKTGTRPESRPVSRHGACQVSISYLGMHSKVPRRRMQSLTKTSPGRVAVMWSEQLLARSSSTHIARPGAPLVLWKQ